MIVLFDLDGTISDSAPGILASLRHAFAEHGIAPLPERAERSLLGPPFYESLPPIVGEDLLWPVIESYRANYSITMYDTAPFAGMPELLEVLGATGHTLAVATSKPEYQAVPIVEHLGVAAHFETVGGDEPDGSRGTKALVIEKVLQRLGNPDPHDVLMVGDRSHDVAGARAHGIDCVGVEWGYAEPGELEAAGAVHICTTPSQIAEIIDSRENAHA